MGFIRKVEFIDGRLVVTVDNDHWKMKQLTHGIKGIVLTDTDPNQTTNSKPLSSMKEECDLHSYPPSSY